MAVRRNFGTPLRRTTLGTPSHNLSQHVDGTSTGTPRRPLTTTRPLPALHDSSLDEGRTNDSYVKLFVDK